MEDETKNEAIWVNEIRYTKLDVEALEVIHEAYRHFMDNKPSLFTLQDMIDCWKSGYNADESGTPISDYFKEKFNIDLP